MALNSGYFCAAISPLRITNEKRTKILHATPASRTNREATDFCARKQLVEGKEGCIWVYLDALINIARLLVMKGCDSLRAERIPKIVLVCQQAPCLVPWMPETFLARFPVFRFLSKMCRPSANTENSRCTREKPLAPRVSVWEKGEKIERGFFHPFPKQRACSQARIIRDSR